MFVSVVCDIGSEDNKEAVYNVLKMYGFKEIISNVFESTKIKEDSLLRLKRDIDKNTDHYDKIRFYQFPFDETFAITFLTQKERWGLRRIEGLTKQKITRMMLPSAEDIKLHREAELLEKVMVWLRRGRCNREREIVAQLLEEGHDLTAVAAVALKLARAEEKQRPIAPLKAVADFSAPAAGPEYQPRVAGTVQEQQIHGDGACGAQQITRAARKVEQRQVERESCGDRAEVRARPNAQIVKRHRQVADHHVKRYRGPHGDVGLSSRSNGGDDAGLPACPQSEQAEDSGADDANQQWQKRTNARRPR